jgi:general secretion pathway protein A
VTIELTPCEEFHGLRARPFSLTPDLRFTFHSKSHTHALEEIGQALKRREGLVVVVGEVGTGKTMLCRALLDTFETRTFISVILDPLLTVEDLLHQVLTDFGLMSARDPSQPRPALTDVARHDMVAALQRFLASLIPLNAHAVIMIDEAQHLTGPVLEQVRLLSNFETDAAKLLQIVLVGQPNLDIVLQRPDMRQLNQRVARRFALQPLSEAEVSDYIERRLLVASENPADGRRDLDLSNSEPMVRFAPAAAKLVAGISKGIPRLVNTLCDRALDVAFERQSHVVDRQAVLEAADRLRLPVPPRRGRAGRQFAAAAALVALVGGGVWWWMQRPPAPAATAPITALPPPAAAPVEPAPVEPAPSVTATPATAGTPTPPPAEASAPAATAPPAATPAEPPASARFEITAASFRTEERASAVTASLARTGLPAATRIDATGEWYRVVVGPFESREDALDAQQQLDGQGFRGTRIYSR